MGYCPLQPVTNCFPQSGGNRVTKAAEVIFFNLYNDCKRSEAGGHHKGSQTSPIPGRLADQGPVPGGGTSEHSDRGKPDTVLKVDNQSREVQTQTNSRFFCLWAKNTT